MGTGRPWPQRPVCARELSCVASPPSLFLSLLTAAAGLAATPGLDLPLSGPMILGALSSCEVRRWDSPRAAHWKRSAQRRWWAEARAGLNHSVSSTLSPLPPQPSPSSPLGIMMHEHLFSAWHCAKYFTWKQLNSYHCYVRNWEGGVEWFRSSPGGSFLVA